MVSPHPGRHPEADRGVR